MVILGIWDGHDSGAALVVDGRIVAAVNEERLTRRKLEVCFPWKSMHACLAMAGLGAEAVDILAASTTDPAKTLARWQPSLKETYYQTRRRKIRPGRLTAARKAVKYWITEWPPNGLSRRASDIALTRGLARGGFSRARLLMFDHHYCHAVAAQHASGFDSCAVVTLDGVGDGLSSTISRATGDTLSVVAASDARDSLGIFFEHVTNLMNMRELEDEGKVMALADYAAPVPDDENPLLDLFRVSDGRIRTTVAGHSMMARLRSVQWQYANEQFAYMAQRTVEHVCVQVACDAVRLTGLSRVALGGGVASNVKANRRIRRADGIEDVFVFPHMGDGGLALGAAVAAAREVKMPLERGTNFDIALGPSFPDADVARSLDRAGLAVTRPSNLPACAADLIAQGRVVMWFQGGMEFGPRALGHRSVLARPDRTDIRDRLNLVLKQRVWYQPFCPSMLESEAARVLEDYSGRPNRHMTMAYMVRPTYRGQMAGVTSIDGSCRPHMVSDRDTGPFAELMRAVQERTGFGVVLNTSFNIHGESLVCTPEEAIDVFRRTGADALAMQSFLVTAPPR